MGEKSGSSAIVVSAAIGALGVIIAALISSGVFRHEGSTAVPTSSSTTSFRPYPADAERYCKDFAEAWYHRDRDRMIELSSEQVADAMLKHETPAAPIVSYEPRATVCNIRFGKDAPAWGALIELRKVGFAGAIQGFI
jgi:hypothetical protein